MANKGSSGWSRIKEKLETFDRQGLVGLVKDLFEYSADNRAFLNARFADAGQEQAALEEHRRRIIEVFFPKRGFSDLKLGPARKAIRDYHKATSDLAGTLDLMLTYAETGTKFTNQFGDIDEPFYNSLESVLDDLAKRLKTSEGAEMYPRFRERLLKLARAAGYIGWGYGDYVTSTVKELEAILGQE
jgi:hypothetical protein